MAFDGLIDALERDEDREADILKEFKERRKGAELALRTWQDGAQNDFDFYAGKQWPEDDIAKLDIEFRPAVTMNRIAPIIDSVSGAETTNRYETRFLPQGFAAGDIDEQLAETIGQAYKWTRSRCNQEHIESGAFRDCLICGVGATEKYVNYEQNPDGVISVKRINPLEVLWDPGAQDQNYLDARFVIRGKWVPEDEFKTLFPERADEFFHFAAQGGGGARRIWNTVTRTKDTGTDAWMSRSGGYYDARSRMVLVFEYQWFERTREVRIFTPGGDPIWATLDEAPQIIDQLRQQLMLQQMMAAMQAQMAPPLGAPPQPPQGMPNAATGMPPGGPPQQPAAAPPQSAPQATPPPFQVPSSAPSAQPSQLSPGVTSVDVPDQQLPPPDPSQGPIIDYVELPRRKYYRAFIAGEVMLDYGAAPVEEFSYKFMTAYEHRRDDGRVEHRGLVFRARDAQKLANKFISSAIHIWASDPKGGIIYEEGAFANPAKAQQDFAKPGAFIKANSGGLAKIQPIAAGRSFGGTQELFNLATDGIPMTIGVNENYFAGGAQDLRRTASAAISSVQNQTLNVLASPFDSLRMWRKEDGRLTLKFMRNFMSDGQLVRIEGPDGNPQIVPFVKDWTAAEYDVLVDEAPTQPNKGQEFMKTVVPVLSEIAKLVPIPPSIVELTDWPEAFKADLRQAIADQQKQKSAPAPVPTEAIPYDSLPATGKVQMAAQAGIQLTPQDVAAQSAQNTIPNGGPPQ